MIRTLGLCVVVFFAFAVGSSGGGASAEEDYTGGNWLLGSCQISLKHAEEPTFHGDVYEAYRAGVCVGLVQGVSDASAKVCPPANSTYEQGIRVATKYLEDHPEELHLKNSALVEKALARAFPCR